MNRASVDPFHERVANIAPAAAKEHGFALGGGLALLAHGVLDRPTEDIDLFSDRDGSVRAAARLVRLALEAAGIDVEEADRTGDTTTLDLFFGPTNVRFWRLAMEVDGGDPSKAVAIARDTNPLSLDVPMRQVSFYTDTGRALARLHKDKEAVRMLLIAERVAPERVRSDPLVAETARSLLDRSRREAGGTELRGLCERLGALA